MKKNVLAALFSLFFAASLFAQVPVRWVKVVITNPDSTQGCGISHPIWYPQVDSCAGAQKINRWLKKNRDEWADFNYKGKDCDGYKFEAQSVVRLTFNAKGLLSFTHDYYRETNINAKQFDHYGVTFDTRTGELLTTDDFIDQDALAVKTALQSADNCFLEKTGLTIPSYEGNQGFDFKTLKPFAKKRYRYLFR
jgi:hypothetical protein